MYVFREPAASHGRRAKFASFTCGWAAKRIQNTHIKMSAHRHPILEDNDDCVERDSRRGSGERSEASPGGDRGIVAPHADLGAPQFSAPRPPAQASSQRPVCLRRERGGIDERWFASTTEAANQGRVWHEGLSFVSFDGQQFTLKDAVAAHGPSLVGKTMWDTYKRWPVYSKFFDNMGPIPHHMHQKHEHAKLTGQEGKPESYYFPPQYNNVDNNFCYTFMGLEPGTTKAQLRKCLEDWSKGDNGILDLSRAIA